MAPTGLGGSGPNKLHGFKMLAADSSKARAATMYLQGVYRYQGARSFQDNSGTALYFYIPAGHTPQDLIKMASQKGFQLASTGEVSSLPKYA